MDPDSRHGADRNWKFLFTVLIFRLFRTYREDFFYVSIFWRDIHLEL